MLEKYKNRILILRNLALVVIILLIISIVKTGNEGLFRFDSSPKTQENEFVKVVKIIMPEVAEISDKDDNSVSVLRNSQGDEIGKAYYSSPISDEIIGYSGNTPLVIITDMNEEIQGIIDLPNSEDYDFWQMVKNNGLLTKWNKLSLFSAESLDVDVVAGATFSSNAVIETVKKVSASAKANTPQEQESSSKKQIELQRSWPINYHLVFGILVILSAIITSLFAKIKKYRKIQLLLNVAVLGCFFGSFISINNLIGRIAGRFLWGGNALVGVLICAAVIMPLVTGKSFYCTWLCPLGSLQELINSIMKKKYKLPKWLNNFQDYFVGVLLFLWFIGFGMEIMNYELFPAMIYNTYNYPLISALIIVVIASLFITRPYCRLICPTGWILSLYEQIQVKKNIVKEDKPMNVKGNFHKQLMIVVFSLKVFVVLAAMFGVFKIFKGENMEQAPASNREIVLSNIHNRKSVRNFIKDKTIAKEELEILVKAGMAAPSGRNMQPWHFIVIDDKAMILEIAKLNPINKMINDCSALIIVACDTNKTPSPNYWVQDASAATENILLAAEAMGYGAVWTGLWPKRAFDETLREMLNIPTHIDFLSMIPIGYATGEDKPKDKWNSELLHWQKW